jgi:hypothetical protein
LSLYPRLLPIQRNLFRHRNHPKNIAISKELIMQDQPTSPSSDSIPMDQQQQQSQPQSQSSNLDFDNLLEKQRELLKHIRSSPDTKKDLVDGIQLGLLVNNDDSCQPKSPASTLTEWGYSFERIPSKSAADGAEAGLSVAVPSLDVAATTTEATTTVSKKSKKQRRQERQLAEEWISDWNFERITSSSKCSKEESAAVVVAASSPSPAFLHHGHDDSESCTTPEWYFERIPPSSSTQVKCHPDDDDSVMDLMMDDHHVDDDEFATLEAAVHDADDDDDDDISLEDLVIVDGDDDDDVGEDDNDDVVIMNIDGEEGLLPPQRPFTNEPQYMQELKHRQYTSAYMDELKHRQAEGLAVPVGLYNQRQEMPPIPSYAAELVTVIKPVAAAAAEDNTDMDEDDDASMSDPNAGRSMGTPDSSDHNPKTVIEGLASGSSPTSVMHGPQLPSFSLGFPRPSNHSASRSIESSSSYHGCGGGVQLPCAEGMDDIFKNTLQKLTQSMKRSAESRRSLKIKTEHTQEYERNLCVYQILQSVENSSRQVDTCLQMYRPRGDGVLEGMRPAASS